MKLKALAVVVVALVGAWVLGACQNITPQQAQAIVATFEALPAPQRTAIAEKAVAYVQSLSPDQKTAIQATMTAAQALAKQQHDQQPAGAPLAAPAALSAPAANATQAPSQAPVILNFFASEPSPAERSQGVAFFLNYDTLNATRVEIAGYVMDNPQVGRWPVWGDDPTTVPNEWAIWAANDTAWVDQWLQIEYDTDRGSSFQPVTVNSRNVSLSLRDPQYVDGDAVELRVNGQSFGSFVMDGRKITLPLVLNSGQNTVEVIATNPGAVPPTIVELTLSNVTSGSAVQVSRALQPGQSDTLSVTAP